MKITEVVAELIWNGNEFMICQRLVQKAKICKDKDNNQRKENE